MNIIEEEIRQIDKEVTLANQTLEELFSFQPNVSLRLFETGHTLLLTFEHMFFEKFERYLTIHLIPELHAQLENPDLADELRPRVFFVALKDLFKLYHRFVSFWEAIEKDARKFDLIKRQIREAIAFKVLPKICSSKYFQLFFEQCFGFYKETISENFAKTANNPKSAQLTANFSTIERLIPKVALPQARDHLDLGFLYNWMETILTNDDIFQEELFQMLCTQCQKFIANFPSPNQNKESRQTLLSCFHNIFIRRFVDYVVYEVSMSHRPFRTSQSQIQLSHNEFSSQRQNAQLDQNPKIQRNNFITEPGGPASIFKKSAHQAKQDFIKTPEQQTKLSEQPPGLGIHSKLADSHTQYFTSPPNQQSHLNQEISSNKNPPNMNMPHHQLLQQNVKFKRQDLCNSLKLLLHKKFIRAMQSHLFSIVENVDENAILVADLKKSLLEIGNFEEFSLALQEKVIQPLISLSKSTPTLLFFYINILKLWTSLGHDFQLLQKSTATLKRYLINREDALRCIVRMWILEIQSKESPNSQKPPNAPAMPIVYEKEDLSDLENAEDSDVDFHITSGKRASNKLKYKKSDVRTLLVDLYGSKEKFLKEYESFLAEKLLYFKPINLKEEAANIQLLKTHLRLGSNQTKWNVLVSDIEASLELTRNFQREHRDAGNFSFLVVSKSFWPIDYDWQGFSLNFPPLAEVQKAFNGHYMRNNKWRKLNFHSSLGIVELDFSLNGRTISAQCQPVHAALVQVFSQSRFYESGAPLGEIARLLECSPEFVRQKMYFWINANIVREVNNSGQTVNPKSSANLADFLSKNIGEASSDLEGVVYWVNKDYSGSETHFVHQEEDNEMILKGVEAGRGSEETQQQRAKIEGLIKAVLKSSGAKTQAKIFELLKKIYKNEVPVMLTEAAFAKILQRLVKKNVISHQGEIYYVV